MAVTLRSFFVACALGLLAVAGGTSSSAAPADGMSAVTVPRVEVHEPKVDGALSSAHVHRVVEEKKKVFLYCYDKALRENDGLHGILRVDFAIAKDGKVAVVKASGPEALKKGLGGCVSAPFHRMRFPAPGDEKLVRVGLLLGFTYKK